MTEATIQKPTVVGPLVEDIEGKSVIQFRVGGKDPASKVTVHLPLPTCPTIAELIAAKGEENILPLIQNLLLEAYTEGVRDSYNSARKFDEGTNTFTFPTLPDSFNAIDSLLSALSPVARARKASAARDNFSFTPDDFKVLIEAYVKAFTMRNIQKSNVPPADKAIKELSVAMQTIFCGKTTDRTLVAFQKFGSTALFSYLMENATPDEMRHQVAGRIQYVFEAVAETAEAAKRSKVDWND